MADTLSSINAIPSWANQSQFQGSYVRPKLEGDSHGQLVQINKAFLENMARSETAKEHAQIARDLQKELRGEPQSEVYEQIQVHLDNADFYAAIGLGDESIGSLEQATDLLIKYYWMPPPPTTAIAVPPPPEASLLSIAGLSHLTGNLTQPCDDENCPECDHYRPEFPKLINGASSMASGAGGQRGAATTVPTMVVPPPPPPPGPNVFVPSQANSWQSGYSNGPPAPGGSVSASSIPPPPPPVGSQAGSQVSSSPMANWIAPQSATTGLFVSQMGPPPPAPPQVSTNPPFQSSKKGTSRRSAKSTKASGQSPTVQFSQGPSYGGVSVPHNWTNQSAQQSVGTNSVPFNPEPVPAHPPSMAPPPPPPPGQSSAASYGIPTQMTTGNSSVSFGQRCNGSRYPVANPMCIQDMAVW